MKITSNKLTKKYTELTDSESINPLDKDLSLVEYDPLNFNKVTVHISNRWVKSLVEHVLVGLRNILYVSGYCTFSSRRETNSILHIISLFSNDNEKDALDRIKFLTARIICDITCHELPERPEHVSENESLLKGEWNRFLRPRIARTKKGPTEKGLVVAFSILQLKRCFPELPKSILYTTAVKHSKRLAMDNSNTEKPFKDAIRRVVNELFPPGWDLKEYSSEPKYTLSNKSCFEATRRQGGNQLAAHDAFKHDLQDNSSSEERNFKSEEELFAMYVPSNGGNHKELYSSVPKMADLEFRQSLINENSKKLYGKASVAFVADPGKWRPVTKSNWTYGSLKPYQKAIHGTLRQFDQFRLIGKTVTKEDVEFFSTMLEDECALSGDYEAATDNLKHDASVECLGQIIDNMRSDWAIEETRKNFAKNSMTNLEIHYPDSLVELGDELPSSFIQKGGQLMGSLLSFPILCVINYAMWTEYKHRVTGSYPLATRDNNWRKEDFVLINGDDIAGIVKKKRDETVWQHCVRSVGLTPSLGKNYVSREFVTINSQLFHLTPHVVDNKERIRMKYLPWVNLGLLQPLGTTKQTKDLRDIAEEKGQDPLESLGKMHDDFVSQCLVPERGSSCFIHAHRKELGTTFRNLFGPIHLGGLGATPVAGTKGSVLEGYSNRQLLIATLLDQEEISLPSYGKVQTIKSSADFLSKIDFPDRIKVMFSDPENLLTYHVPHNMEDVTDAIDQLCLSYINLLSWLKPIALDEREGNDRTFFNRTIRQFSKKFISKMDVWEYLNASPKVIRYFVARDFSEKIDLIDSASGFSSLNDYLLESCTDGGDSLFPSELFRSLSDGSRILQNHHYQDCTVEWLIDNNYLPSTFGIGLE
jgi:hypothetical protein